MATFEYRKDQDMFEHIDTPDQSFVITVNCFGTMGKGQALAAKKADPALAKQYHEDCKARRVRPGVAYCVLDAKHIIFPTKNNWKHSSRYSWIGTGLKRIKDGAEKLKGRTVHMNLPGCGNGRLNAVKVHNMLKNVLGETDLELVIYLSSAQWDELTKAAEAKKEQVAKAEQAA